jgi:hypothetical protein
MQELNSLPVTLRQRLELAEAEPQPQAQITSPMLAMQQAFVQLAQADPELAGLILASSFGYTQFTRSTSERTSSRTETERRRFGLRVGSDFSSTINERTTTHTIRLDR